MMDANEKIAFAIVFKFENITGNLKNVFLCYERIIKKFHLFNIIRATKGSP